MTDRGARRSQARHKSRRQLVRGLGKRDDASERRPEPPGTAVVGKDAIARAALGRSRLGSPTMGLSDETKALLAKSRSIKDQKIEMMGRNKSMRELRAILEAGALSWSGGSAADVRPPGAYTAGDLRAVITSGADWPEREPPPDPAESLPPVYRTPDRVPTVAGPRTEDERRVRATRRSHGLEQSVLISTAIESSLTPRQPDDDDDDGAPPTPRVTKRQKQQRREERRRRAQEEMNAVPRKPFELKDGGARSQLSPRLNKWLSHQVFLKRSRVSAELKFIQGWH